MLQYLKKYPLSLLTIAVILFLSLFNPPQMEEEITIPHLDKLVHIGMYGTLSGLLWVEYLKKHHNQFNLRRVLVGAGLLPILMGGLIELMQAYMTTYRSGEWMDLLANSTGVFLACIIGYYKLRPYFDKHA